MTLLDFARGPALQWSLAIMLFGIFLRLFGTLLMGRHQPLSRPRRTSTFVAGLRTIWRRSFPPPVFSKSIAYQHTTGYIFHIGLFVVIFLFAPHIAFFKDLLGVSWPALPNVAITVAAAVTIAVLIALLIRRMTHPVLRMISGPDDYFSWLVTTAPLVTGMMTYAHFGPRYETMLAIHILSVELLFIWIPFGKLIHMLTFIPSRAQQGVKFERRGVQA